MSSSAASPSLYCNEDRSTQQCLSKTHTLKQRQSLFPHELTCLLPSGSAEQQALQQQALHQAALHNLCMTDGTQHPFALHSCQGTCDRVAKVEFAGADSFSTSSVPCSDALNDFTDNDEGKVRGSIDSQTVSGTVQADESCPRSIASPQVDPTDYDTAGTHALLSPVDGGPQSNVCSSLTPEDPMDKLEQTKDDNLLKDGSVSCSNESKAATSRPKCRNIESCIDGDVESGAFATREESIKGLKAGLIHVAHKMPKNAHAHFVLGLMYQRLEQPAKAASAFQKADEIIKKSEEEFGKSRAQLSSVVQCHYAMTMLQARVIGDVYLGSDLRSIDAEGWVKDLKLAVQIDLSYSLVWNTLGLVFFQIGQTEIATSIFRSLLCAVPNCLDAFANLGVAYLQRGHLANAARCLQSLLEKDSAYPGALLNYATLLLHQYGSSFNGVAGSASGEIAAMTAQKCLLAALNVNPKAGHLWASLAAAYSLLGDFPSTTKCLEQAHKLEPMRLSIRYAVAMQRVQESQMDLADSEGLSWAANEIVSILSVRDSAAIQPYIAWAGLAKVLRMQHEVVAAFEGDETYLRETRARAFHSLQQAVEENPRDPMQWQQLGLYALHTLQFKLAEDFFKMAIAQRQTCGALWSNLGISLELSEELALAEEVYQKALSLVSQDKAHMVLSNLGNLYRQQRRFADAHAAFQRALEICPNYAPACNNLGLLLVMEGKLDEAIKMFDCALHSDAHLDAAKSNRMKAQTLVAASGNKGMRR